MNELREAGAQLIIGDVTDRRGMERALADSHASTVFHLAGVVRSRLHGEFERVNEHGVEVVAGACAARPRPPVLVVVSSLAAVGPGAADPLRTEASGPAPVSNYGRSKLAGERAATKYAGAIPLSIVRPPIVFGPGDRGVLEMFRPIARWGVHMMPARGDFCLSLVHVDDLVEGLMLAAEKGERLAAHSAPGDGVYFMANEEFPSYAELGRAIATSLGQKMPVMIHVPGSIARLVGTCCDVTAWVRRRPSWLNSDKITEALAGSWTCSSAKARAQLGWSPSRSLAERLHETAQWYRDAGWL